MGQRLCVPAAGLVAATRATTISPCSAASSELPHPLALLPEPLHPVGTSQHPCPIAPQGPGIPIPAPRTLPCTGDSGVALGVPVLLGVTCEQEQ